MITQNGQKQNVNYFIFLNEFISVLQGSGGSEEMLKWEEGKKWQKTVEKMKSKIKDRDMEIDRLQKANKMLKDLVERQVYEPEQFDHMKSQKYKVEC